MFYRSASLSKKIKVRSRSCARKIRGSDCCDTTSFILYKAHEREPVFLPKEKKYDGFVELYIVVSQVYFIRRRWEKQGKIVKKAAALQKRPPGVMRAWICLRQMRSFRAPSAQ